jgi:hypothetical protein
MYPAILNQIRKKHMDKRNFDDDNFSDPTKEASVTLSHPVSRFIGIGIESNVKFVSAINYSCYFEKKF